MSAVQDAIDELTAALNAIEWPDAVGESVIVDNTPGRVWTLEERQKRPCVYVFGGPTGYEFDTRAVHLLAKPVVFVTVMRALSFSDGQISQEALNAAEAIAVQVLQTARTWAKTSARFAPEKFEQPERWDADQMLTGQYMTTFAISLVDGQYV